MNFKEFINHAWRDHATQAEQVAGRLKEGFSLLSENDQIPPFSQLIAHVLGEHLGKWSEGIDLLNQLKTLNAFDPKSESHDAILRAVASMELAMGQSSSMETLNVSGQIRALAVAASALSAQNKIDLAKRLFVDALQRAESKLPKDDPAHRSLAITGYNLACSLEEKSSISDLETELMILAAQTSRKYWEIAGTWLEVERAEYRLAQTFLKARDPVRSKDHAQSSLKISQDNFASPLELFFGYEALALAQKANELENEFFKARNLAQVEFEKLSDEDKSWCEPSLKKLWEKVQ